MTDQVKQIQLAITGKNLASKPLEEISAAIEGLVAAVGEIVPASERGEDNFKQLTAVAGQFKQAMQGLLKNAAIIQDFQALETEVAASSEKIGELQARLDRAKLAVAAVEKPTRDLKKEVTAATSAFDAQQKTLNRQVAALDKLRAKAAEVGLDLANVASAQERIGVSLAGATGGYDRVNAAIAVFADNQRKAAQAAQDGANAQRRASEEQAASIAAQKAAEDAEAVAFKTATQAKITAEADYQIMLERTRATQERNTAAQKAAQDKDLANAQASRRAVEAAESARAKITASVVADNEAAAAAKRKADADTQAAVAAERWASLEARATQALQEQVPFVDRLVSGLRALSGAEAETANAAERAGSGFKLFNTEGRESLSLYQRLRGEVLSLTASFVGFYGAIQSVGAILETVQKTNTAKNALAVAFGVDNVGAQMSYVRDQAERLGIRMLDLAQSYGKFAIAAKDAGISAESTRFIFETFSEVSRTLHQSQEQTNDIFLALQQIASKGTVNMQDLRRQLGEHLPGAIGAFSQALHISEADFVKLVESGKLGAATLLNFAIKVRSEYAEALPGALHTAQAEIGRFQTALDDLKNEVFEGAFGDAFVRLTVKITKFLKEEDGKEFARNISSAMGSVASAIGTLVDNLSTVKLVLEALALRFAITFGLSQLRLLATMIGAIGTLITTIRAATGAAIGLGTAIGLAAGVVGGILLLFQIGKLLYDQVPAVHRFVDRMVAMFETAWANIKYAGKVAFAFVFDPSNFDKVKAQLDKELKETKDKINADLAESLQQDQAEGSSTAHRTTHGNGRAGGLSTTLAKEAADAQAQADQARIDAVNKAAQTIQDRLDELRGTTLRKEATTLQEFTAAIREGYKPIFADIDKLAKDFPGDAVKVAASLRAQLNEIIHAQVKDQGEKFQTNNAKAEAQQINDLLRDRDALTAAITEKNKAQHAPLSKIREDVAAINDEYNGKIVQQTEALLEKIRGLPAAVQDKLRETIAHLETTLIRAQTGGEDVDLVDRIKEAYQLVNQQLQIRNARIEAAKNDEIAGNATRAQTIQKLKEINTEYAGTVEQLRLLIQYVETDKDLTVEQKEALLETLLAMQKTAAAVKAVRTEIYTGTQAAEDLAAGGVQVADGFAKALIATGSLSGAFSGARDAFLNFAADFLLKIGEMIIKQQILNALSEASKASGWLGTAASAVSAAATAHSGWHVGDARAPSRTLPNWVWNMAPRLHTGTLPGLRHDEVPAVLQKGEGVLSRDQMRGVGGGGGKMDVRVINTLNSESLVREGLGAPGNAKIILNEVRANRASYRRVLGIS